jgi:hypothetical protein
MKKFKMILLLIIGCFIGIFVYQNWTVFTYPFDLRLNIGFKHYELLGIQSSFIFLSLFLLGFLLAYFLGLGERLKGRRALRSSNEKIEKMEEELNMLRNAPSTLESTTAEDIAPEDIVSK